MIECDRFGGSEISDIDLIIGTPLTCRDFWFNKAAIADNLFSLAYFTRVSVSENAGEVMEDLLEFLYKSDETSRGSDQGASTLFWTQDEFPGLAQDALCNGTVSMECQEVHDEEHVEAEPQELQDGPLLPR